MEKDRRGIDAYFSIDRGGRPLRSTLNPVVESVLQVRMNQGEIGGQLTLDGDEEIFSYKAAVVDPIPMPLKKDRTVKSIQAELASFQSDRPVMKAHDKPITILEKQRAEWEELYVESYDHPTPEQLQNIKQELADNLIYLLVYANYYGIDAGQAMTEKIAVNRERFPISLWSGGLDWWDAYIESKKRSGEYDPKKHKRPEPPHEPTYDDIM